MKVPCAQQCVHPTGGSRRVFRLFAWLEAGSGKVALSHPTHQRVTPAVRRLLSKDYMQPELKQFGTLTQADFERFPVWANVHSHDYNESWYDESDEETFRPWSGELPVDPDLGMFLVRAQIRLVDGTQVIGFLTPAVGSGKVSENELGVVQPYLFSESGPLVTFWGGMFGFTDEAKKSAYDLLGRNANQIFPIKFRAEDGLAKGKQAGEIRGFYQLIDFKSQKVESTI
jgi:hypothetical protein